MIRATLSLIFILLSLQVYAQDDGGARELVEDFKTDKYSLKLGLIDYHYEEPGLMKIHGRMYEVEGGYRNLFHWGPRPMIYGGKISLSAGSNTYDGGIAHKNGAVTPASSPSADKIFDFEGFFGTTLLSLEHHTIEVHLGPGLWFLLNKIDGDGSYSRNITYFYMPAGAAYSFKMWNLKMNLGAQYDVFVYGMAQSALSELSSAYTDVTNSQTAGNGARINAGFEYAFSRWSLTLDGYYKTWNIADSDSQFSGGKYWREPKNTTKMTGVNVGARF